MALRISAIGVALYRMSGPGDTGKYFYHNLDLHQTHPPTIVITAPFNPNIVLNNSSSIPSSNLYWLPDGDTLSASSHASTHSRQWLETGQVAGTTDSSRRGPGSNSSHHRHDPHGSGPTPGGPPKRANISDFKGTPLYPILTATKCRFIVLAYASGIFFSDKDTGPQAKFRAIGLAEEAFGEQCMHAEHSAYRFYGLILQVTTNITFIIDLGEYAHEITPSMSEMVCH